MCKFKNTYTQDNRQLFEIIGQIHRKNKMLLNRYFYLVVLLASSSSDASFNTASILTVMADVIFPERRLNGIEQLPYSKQ